MFGLICWHMLAYTCSSWNDFQRWNVAAEKLLYVLSVMRIVTGRPARIGWYWVNLDEFGWCGMMCEVMWGAGMCMWRPKVSNMQPSPSFTPFLARPIHLVPRQVAAAPPPISKPEKMIAKEAGHISALCMNMHEPRDASCGWILEDTAG